MKKRCFIVPYFGAFPNTFSLFLASVKENVEFDWLFFTDNDYPEPIPQNVRFIQMEFSDIQDLIQSKFPFKTTLNTPYKLCDYKCAYGYIFEGYIREYSHWGYCDIDLIFGRIAHFVDSDMLERYDKIGHLGHFSLYKNNQTVNTSFMLDDYYKEVFASDRIFVFDEWNDGSINRILLKHGYLLCRLDSWTDIYPHNSYLNQVRCVFDDEQNAFFHADKKLHFFEWDKGILRDYLLNSTRMQTKEIMYVHLQKREMTLSNCLKNGSVVHFYCVPDLYLDASEWKLEKYLLLSLIRKIVDIKQLRFLRKKAVYLLKEKIYLFLKG